MNTSQLKTFAQKARNIIREGVSRQLKYWGFDEKGNVECRPEKVEGGIVHREEIIDDPSVMKRWETLNHAVKHQGFDQVVEEAAYTWFNRMMAIRILSKNGYDVPQLEYGADGAQTPLILQRARRGQFAFLNKEEQTRLKQVLTDYSKDTQAFAILLTGYCHSHSLLNSIFGRLDDYTELLLPADMLNETGFIHFLNTTTAISDDDYRQVELIGWLYQFYISEKKDQVFAQFKKNQKAEAKDIPAATQIFTPNWIVKYMVENTVGKIWLDKHPGSPLKAGWKYLVESPDQPLGDPLISEISQLKLLDPAAGSGHILVEGFELLFQMYLEEYYMPEEAVESILKNNLFGLDIDLRAAQLARFAILMKAASKYPEILQKNILPKVFAMPEPASFSRQEILDFLGSEGRPYEEKLGEALRLMQQAQNLGSVMKFDFSAEERSFIVNRLENLKYKAFRDNLEEVLLQKIAPFIEVLVILTDRYEAIAANPPYMGQGNMNGELKQYVNQHYPLSKSDLFAVFIEVMIDRLESNARLGCITMESWMFLSSYEKLRNYLLNNYSIVSLAHFGWHIIGIAFGTASLILEKSKETKSGQYSYLTIEDMDRNLNVPIVFPKKDNGRFAILEQSKFSKIPGSPIAYSLSDKFIIAFDHKPIGFYGKAVLGMNSTNNELFVKFWFEIDNSNFHKSCVNHEDTIGVKKWFPYNKGGVYRKWFGNRLHVLNWKNKGEDIHRYNNIDFEHKGAPVRGKQFQFKESISWSFVTSGNFAVRFSPPGSLFDVAGSSLFASHEKIFHLLGFLNCNIASYILKIIAPTLNFQVGNISSLPVASIFIDEIENTAKHCISISIEDWNIHETSWDFKTTPLFDALLGDIGMSSSQFVKSRLQSALQNGVFLEKVVQDYVALWSLLFYRLHKNEEELNRIFIDIYGLNEELHPQVPLKDITILQEELDTKALEKTEKALQKRRQWKLEQGKWQLFEDESKPLPELPIKRDVVMKQLVSYSIGCMMGRYRLDQPGLHIAQPNPTHEEVCTYDFNGHEFEIDDDGIIPLMGSNCTFPDDAVNRFNYFLEVVWGAETLTQNKNFLVDCLNQEIEKYLVKDFWKDHCQTYKKKPIYWLFASEKGAFQVLTYMHRMNRFTAEKIRSKYLLKHLQYLQQEIGLLENMSGLSRDEQKRLDTLRTQYDECVRYELLLKDCADHQIEFDLDDGVTVNYELFKGVVAPIK
jgi:hypothetical protein